VKRLIVVVIAIGAGLLPALAEACPSCATREGPGVGMFAMLAGLVAVPYGVAVVALKVIRKIDHQTADRPDEDSAC
jgi:hypothetical protein